LFLGSSYDATDVDWLNEKHITHVINCAEAIPNYEKNVVGNTKIRKVWVLDAKDDPDYPILENHLADVDQFLKEAFYEPDGRALIHCRAGMNRSPALAIAASANLFPSPINTRLSRFVMFYETVAKQRPFVLENEGFYQQLLKWAHE
jgi:predicted protein tyrosine phosphatase